MRDRCSILVALLIGWVTIMSLPPDAAADEAIRSEAPARCGDDPLYSRLDFWLGDWDVHSGDAPVGTNRIEKTLDGCAVLEHWKGAGGGRGMSLFYVDGERRWRQVWVTERANRVGGVKEKSWQPMPSADAVRFQGEIPLPDGGSYLDRTTLTRLDDGRVRQLIEVSKDGGQTWSAAFDALYEPRDIPAPKPVPAPR